MQGHLEAGKTHCDELDAHREWMQVIQHKILGKQS